MKDVTKKVVQRLKEVKTQKNLTCQDIVDACEALNTSVSLSTVRRIFSKGSEEGPDYRQYTINAIFNAIIGTEEAERSTAEDEHAENAALKAVVEMKDATIADLQKQIETLTQENAVLTRTIADMQIRLDATNEVIRMAVEVFKK